MGCYSRPSFFIDMSQSPPSPPLLLLQYKPHRWIDRNEDAKIWIEFCREEVWRMFRVVHRSIEEENSQSTTLYLLYESMMNRYRAFSTQVQRRYDLIDLINTITQEHNEYYSALVPILQTQYPNVLSSLIIEYVLPSPVMELASGMRTLIPSVSMLYDAFYDHYRYQEFCKGDI